MYKLNKQKQHGTRCHTKVGLTLRRQTGSQTGVVHTRQVVNTQNCNSTKLPTSQRLTNDFFLHTTAMIKIQISITATIYLSEENIFRYLVHLLTKFCQSSDKIHRGIGKN